MTEILIPEGHDALARATAARSRTPRFRLRPGRTGLLAAGALLICGSALAATGALDRPRMPDVDRNAPRTVIAENNGVTISKMTGVRDECISVRASNGAGGIGCTAKGELEKPDAAMISIDYAGRGRWRTTAVFPLAVRDAIFEIDGRHRRVETVNGTASILTSTSPAAVEWTTPTGERQRRTFPPMLERLGDLRPPADGAPRDDDVDR